MVATILRENNIEFDWFDLNDNKFNTLIYRKEIHDVEKLDANQLSILTVWPENKKMQLEITQFLTKKGLELGINCWLF